MTLSSNVHPLPWYFQPYIRLTKARGFALLGHIYFPKTTFINLQSKNPDHMFISFLLHEQEHVKRQKAAGILNWSLRYQFLKKDRLHEELAAYKVQFTYLQKHHLSYDLARVTKALSGLPYFWCTSYENANKLINRLWLDCKA